MNTPRPRQSRVIFLVIGGVLLLCVCLVVGGLAVYTSLFTRAGVTPRAASTQQFGPFTMPMNPFGRRPVAPVPTGGTYASNGERIFLTGASQSGQPITPVIDGMRMMPPGRLSCASCHGPEGRGGKVSMMMVTFNAPDIRWGTLSQMNPPYTTDTLKRAITQGEDEEGKPLEWQMPRWQMTDSDLNDLVNYIQTLQ